MRISTAYFAGVGTVIVAVGAGLGGGYLAANISSPPSQAVSKLERRMSAESINVSTAPAEPVKHVAATKSAAAPAQEQRQTQPQSQTEAAAPSVYTAPAEAKTANNVAAAQPVQSPPQPSKLADEKTAAARDAFARARDADIKRADAEKRRAERRQRWADRQRLKQPREQELEAVEERVREMTEPRQFFAAEPVRIETPRIRLFDQD